MCEYTTREIDAACLSYKHLHSDGFTAVDRVLQYISRASLISIEYLSDRRNWVGGEYTIMHVQVQVRLRRKNVGCGSVDWVLISMPIEIQIGCNIRFSILDLE